MAGVTEMVVVRGWQWWCGGSGDSGDSGCGCRRGGERKRRLSYGARVEAHGNWNGYLRKGRKTKPKRQNRTRNGKAWKRQSQVKAQV
ncbi:hypothetical protein Tco_1470081 [Tanacetum coccineum]